MSKDYAKNRFRRTPLQSRGASTNILWLIIGILTGVLLANLGIDYIKEQIATLIQKSKQPAQVREIKPEKIKPGQHDKVKEVTPPPANTTSSEDKVNFDFYTILPNSETTMSPPSTANKSAPQPNQQGGSRAAPTAAAALPTPEIKVEQPAAALPTPALKPLLMPTKPVPVVKVPPVKKPVKSEQVNYILQISAFKKPEEADQLKAQLTLIGLEAKIKKTTFDGMTWYRVWLGVYPSLESAEKAQKQLQTKQIKGVLARVK